MGVLLIILIMLGGIPGFDFAVFPDMKSCLEAKDQVVQTLKEKDMPKPLYLECKSDVGPQAKVGE